MSIDKKFGIAVLVLVVLIALDLWAHAFQPPFFPIWTFPLGLALLVTLALWGERVVTHLWKCPGCGGREWSWAGGASVFTSPAQSVGHYYCLKCYHIHGIKADVP